MNTVDGYVPTTMELDGLAASAAVLAKAATSKDDVEFWSTYATGMARESLGSALQESVWVETSTESDTFRSMKLAAIRRDVAYSHIASHAE